MAQADGTLRVRTLRQIFERKPIRALSCMWWPKCLIPVFSLKAAEAVDQRGGVTGDLVPVGVRERGPCVGQTEVVGSSCFSQSSALKVQFIVGVDVLFLNFCHLMTE